MNATKYWNQIKSARVVKPGEHLDCAVEGGYMGVRSPGYALVLETNEGEACFLPLDPDQGELGAAIYGAIKDHILRVSFVDLAKKVGDLHTTALASAQSPPRRRKTTKVPV